MSPMSSYSWWWREKQGSRDLLESRSARMVIGRSATRPTRAGWKTERSRRRSARAGARREGGRRDATSSTSAPTPTSGSGAVVEVTRAKDVRGVRDLEEQIEYVFDPTRGETGPVHLEGAIVPVGFPKGTYLRNGPNSKFGVGKEHYFDGDGMIHGITFLESGGVCYYNRWIETKGLAMENEAGRKLFRGILVNNGLEMLSGVLHNILFNDALSTNGTKDTTNTAVVCHGGRILALMEAQKPALMELKVTRDSVHVFRTKAKDFNFNGELGGNMCAHPKVDPHTGDMIFFSYNMTSEPHMVYTEVDRAGEVRHTMAVDGLSRGVMSHDMAITSTRAVLFDLPVEFSVANIARNEFPVQFQKEARARLGVVERGGSRDVEWFEVQRGGNVFHTVNAFDDERTGEVVLQAMRSEPERSGYIFNDYSPSYLHEWRLTPGTGRVEERRMCGLAGEFPCVNPNYVGRRAKFAYQVVDSLLGNLKQWTYPPIGVVYASFAKVALLDDEVAGIIAGDVLDRYEAEKGIFLGEPQFVPREGAEEEDDGFVVTFATNAVEDRSYFLILDAKDLAAGPISAIEVPQKVASGLHGTWIPL